ncbi:hypothetical protein ISCGN_023312 [Ixodes scapularis]
MTKPKKKTSATEVHRYSQQHHSSIATSKVNDGAPGFKGPTTGPGSSAGAGDSAAGGAAAAAAAPGRSAGAPGHDAGIAVPPSGWSRSARTPASTASRNAGSRWKLSSTQATASGRSLEKGDVPNVAAAAVSTDSAQVEEGSPVLGLRRRGDHEAAAVGAVGCRVRRGQACPAAILSAASVVWPLNRDGICSNDWPRSGPRCSFHRAQLPKTRGASEPTCDVHVATVLDDAPRALNSFRREDPWPLVGPG